MSVSLQKSRVVILVKAMPNPSKKYGETVCCAGVTREGVWKRLFPVRFRHLETKFKRWDWVQFEYGRPTSDRRSESCHVYEDRLRVYGSLKSPDERARLLNPLVSGSTLEAVTQGKSLTLIRPRNPHFFWKRKPDRIIEAEREGYKLASQQSSLFDKEIAALEPVPYTFAFSYEDDAGRHLNQCSDWETSTTYWKFTRQKSEAAALGHLTETYNEKYPQSGMAFAMGTVKRRPGQWLLLGVIRLDTVPSEVAAQTSLAF